MMAKLENDYKIKDFFTEQFGVYLDIPEELEDEEEARAIIGIVVP